MDSVFGRGRYFRSGRVYWNAHRLILQHTLRETNPFHMFTCDGIRAKAVQKRSTEEQDELTACLVSWEQSSIKRDN